MRKATLFLLLAVCSIGNNAWSCNGFTPAVTNNTYIGNGQYLLTIDICEFVSNSETLNGVIIDEAAVNGIIITVNGANVIGINTPSIYGVSSGLTIFPTQPNANQVEYGDWGNSAAPTFLAYGDPQECWQIELIVDGPTASVDIWGSSSESAFQPGLGMVQNGGIWGCGSGIGVPPAVCDASWTVPSLCAGSTTPIDLNPLASGSGTYSGAGVNSGTGIFDPTGLSGTVAVSYLIGDAFFNCTVTQNIVFETVAAPTLTDTTICDGDSAPFEALVTPPAPPVPCTYSISMWDTYGDGWQGGTATVFVDGVPVLSNVALAAGFGPVSYDFDVYAGQTITVTYSPGSFSAENHYTVTDAAGGGGSAIYTGPTGVTPVASQNIANSCTVAPPPPPPAPCTYSISMWDTYGDGWQGGTATVLVDGVPVLTNVALAAGFGPVSYDFGVYAGQTITVTYSSGSFPAENHYAVTDGAGGSGSSLYTGPIGVTPLASQGIGNSCSIAPPPSVGGGACSYELVMSDSYGDGFGGANVDIYINGVPYLMNQTVLSCGGFGNGPCNVSINIPVSDGDIILLNYTTGAFNSENTLFLYDNDGLLVNSINNPPAGNLGAGITAVCPATSMDYSWSPAGSLSDPLISNPIASPTSNTVYTVTVTSPISGCTSTTNVTVTVDNCFLPIELNYFGGSCTGDKSTLDWQTVTEHNNDHFEVEYSSDGVDFEKIGEVDGIGFSTEFHNYTFERVDQEDYVGYYRLRQFDLDGTVKTSNVIAVECIDDDVTAYMANGMIIISSFHEVENVRVLDMSGRVIFNGRSNNIDVSGKGAAVYFLEVETKETTQRLKVVSAGI